MTKEQKNIIYWFAGVSILLVTFSLLFKEYSEYFLSILSIFGAVGSVVGLFFVLKQVYHQGQITEELQKKVDETKTLVKKFSSVADLSKGTKLVGETQTLINNEKYESSILRLRDIKEILISVKHIDGTSRKNKIGEYIVLVEKDLNNIHYYIHRDRSLKREVIISNLEEISTLLQDVQQKIIE
jgi:hypothetical protein